MNQLRLTTTESADITGRIRNLGNDITVLLVAHDMDLVYGVAQRIIVLHYGEIILQGTCDESSAVIRSRKSISAPRRRPRQMLELRDVHTYYGDSYVLQGISLTVKDGSVVPCWAGTAWVRPPPSGPLSASILLVGVLSVLRTG